MLYWQTEFFNNKYLQTDLLPNTISYLKFIIKQPNYNDV